MTESPPAFVSVIVPSHNSAKTIALCVESVLAQTHPHLELIVVDDASTDDTPAIVGRYGCALVRLYTNVGAGIARNHGIRASRGAILFFVDSDVALAPDAVANAVRVLEEDPACAAAWGVYGARPLVDDGIVERVQILNGHYRQTRARPVLTGHFAVGAIRRWVVERVGAFDERLLGQYSQEDHEFGLRIAEHFPVRRALDVVGYHDDDDRMASVVRKCFRRAQSLMPLVVTQRGLRPEREAIHRPSKVIAVLLATASAPLAVLWPHLALVPVAFLLWFIATEAPLLAFVRRAAGWRLVLATVLLSYVYGLAVAAGGLSGAARYLVDARFRRRYRRPAPAAQPVPTG